MTCPNVDILTRFADATLSDHEASEVVAHLAVCETCSRIVEELEHKPEQPMLAAMRDLKNAPTETDDPPLPKKIAQYEILERIGSGGMGVVYRAVHPHLKREVALKVIRDTRLDDPSARERFVQEMQSLGRLSHPNIVHATDAGIDGDVPFIVTELLDGQDLGSYIEEYGRMSVKLAVDCIRQAATGLAYAHKAGYVHRDVKPSNLFLCYNTSDQRERVNTTSGSSQNLTLGPSGFGLKILDLGIARPLAENAGAGQTVAGHVVGSPEFMAPEQLRGRTADARSDIYSLGQTFANILDEPTPSKLRAILARMTAGLPEQRYQTTDELLKAIDTLTTNERIKKNIALTTGIAILMFVVFTALRGSFSNAGNVIESYPIAEPRNFENVKTELKRDAEPEREKGLLASPEEVASLREELDRYKKDKLIYDKEMKEYVEEMKVWEKDKSGFKPPKPIPAFPPIMPPLRFPPEIVEEYKNAIKEWRNDKTDENKSSSPITKQELTQDRNVLSSPRFDDNELPSASSADWTPLKPARELCNKCSGRGFDEIICGECPGYKSSRYCGHDVWLCNLVVLHKSKLILGDFGKSGKLFSSFGKEK